MRDQIIAATKRAMEAVWHLRFYANERGYQGIFYYFLIENLKNERLLEVPGQRLLEIEYQKSARHEMRLRPDIIFHHPNEDHREGVTRYNFAVWALKVGASDDDATKDFADLDQMIGDLGYELGFFINIGADRDCMDLYRGPFADRLIGGWTLARDDGVHLSLRPCQAATNDRMANPR